MLKNLLWNKGSIRSVFLSDSKKLVPIIHNHNLSIYPPRCGHNDWMRSKLEYQKQKQWDLELPVIYWLSYWNYIRLCRYVLVVTVIVTCTTTASYLILSFRLFIVCQLIVYYYWTVQLYEASIYWLSFVILPQGVLVCQKKLDIQFKVIMATMGWEKNPKSKYVFASLSCVRFKTES